MTLNALNKINKITPHKIIIVEDDDIVPDSSAPSITPDAMKWDIDRRKQSQNTPAYIEQGVHIWDISRGENWHGPDRPSDESNRINASAKSNSMIL